MNLIIGKEYVVTHSRKGKFNMRITKMDDTWVTGIITAGKTNTLLAENSKEEGEKETVRREYCKFELKKEK